MDIEIDSKRNNPLLKRTEVHFTVKHEGEGTPNRELIRSELAGKLNVKKENIIVNIIKTGFGIHETTGYAKVYSSSKQSQDLEKDYLLQRNKLVEPKKKEAKEEKPAEVKAEIPAETPAELEPPAEPTPEAPSESETSEAPVACRGLIHPRPVGCGEVDGAGKPAWNACFARVG